MLKSLFVYLLFYVTCLFIFTDCQTTSKNENNIPTVDSGNSYKQWELKALVKNTKTNEANVLTLDIIGKKPNPIRIEVTTSIGIHLASLLILENEIQFILPKSKRYFHGPISQNSLFPILNVKLDPRLLVSALYGETYPDWKCEAQSGTLSGCETPTGEKISWISSAESSKRVELKGNDYEVQVQFKSESQKNEIKENTFKLNVPEQYKKYLLNK